MYESTNKLDYIVDPRIDLKITDSILKMKKNEIELLYRNIILQSFLNQKDTLNEFVNKIFKIYKMNSYIRKEIKTDNFDTNYWALINRRMLLINKRICIYIQSGFNFDECIKKFNSMIMFSKQTIQNNEYTKLLNSFILDVKFYGKYLFLMFLNHLYMVLNIETYCSIEEFSIYKIPFQK